jgi:ABC-2 type transport system ATP-binding protein
VSVVAGVLKASHLTRRFGDRVAVDDVSFELAPGEIFALLGPNGAGKTTTLRMMAGLIAPTTGAVSINGETVTPETAPRLRGEIGFLTEAPGLWDRLTTRQNLMVYARLHGLPDPERAVDTVMDLFDIGDRGGDPAAQLSKGLKQRVALARTLLHQPRIVLLDEPTAGLDPESARHTRALILRLRDERRAIVLSTHNLDEVERIADRVAVLRSRLIGLDTPARLRARVFGARVRIVVAGGADRYATAVRAAGVADVRVDGTAMSIALDSTAVDTPALVRALVNAGADVISVAPEEQPLEDVYLRLLENHPA